MNKLVIKETQEVRDIFGRVRRKDFSGNAGQAIKNSSYQLVTTIIAKISSLLFTIILARILLPELFGLYSLALSTILLMETISNLGINSTLIKFVSRSIGKNNFTKAKAYIVYLAKIKLLLILISSTLLILSSKYLSGTYYNKPIFLALLGGSIYLLFLGINNFLVAVFQSDNNFKKTMYREIIFQSSRIVLIPIAVVLSLKAALSSELLMLIIILFLALSYLISIVYLVISLKNINVRKVKEKKLTKKEKKSVNIFFWALAASAISTMFFAYIDILMLGHFVESIFIGFYQAAFSLVGSVIALLTFSTALFPIFNRLKGRALERGLRKAIRVTMIFSVLVSFLIYISAPFLIKIIFGPEYSSAIPILRIMSILIIGLPVSGLYSSFIISKGAPWTISKISLLSTLINVALNYIFITTLLPYGMMSAVIGATVATILSRYFKLFSLMFAKSRMGK